MVAVEEGGHVAAAFLAFVCDGTDDVDGYVRAEEAQEDELVAVGVPEGGVGIVAEVTLDDLSADIEVLAVGVAAEGGPEEAAVEGAIEEASLALGAAFDLDVAEEALPGLVGFLADLLEGLLEHLCLEVLAGVLDADEAEAELDFEGGWAYVVAEVNEGYLVLGVALDLDAGDGEVADGIEVDAALAVLIALEAVVACLLDVVAAGTVVVARDVNKEALGVGGTEGVAMVAAAEGAGELCLDAIALEVDAVVAWMGLFALVGEMGGVVAGVEDACDRHDGQVEEVPVTLGGMAEAVDLVVLVLVACSAVVLGDGGELDHGIGEGCPWEDFRTPGALLFRVGVAEVLRLPEGGGAQEGVDILGEGGALGSQGGSAGGKEDAQEDQDSFCFHISKFSF